LLTAEIESGKKIKWIKKERADFRKLSGKKIHGSVVN
jgi:hypothetical protein